MEMLNARDAREVEKKLALMKPQDDDDEDAVGKKDKPTRKIWCCKSVSKIGQKKQILQIP